LPAEFLFFLEVEHAGDDGGRELLYFIVVLQYFVVVSLAEKLILFSVEVNSSCKARKF